MQVSVPQVPAMTVSPEPAVVGGQRSQGVGFMSVLQDLPAGPAAGQTEGFGPDIIPTEHGQTIAAAASDGAPGGEISLSAQVLQALSRPTPAADGQTTPDSLPNPQISMAQPVAGSSFGGVPGARLSSEAATEIGWTQASRPTSAAPVPLTGPNLPDLPAPTAAAMGSKGLPGADPVPQLIGEGAMKSPDMAAVPPEPGAYRPQAGSSQASGTSGPQGAAPADTQAPIRGVLPDQAATNAPAKGLITAPGQSLDPQAVAQTRQNPQSGPSVPESAASGRTTEVIRPAPSPTRPAVAAATAPEVMPQAAMAADQPITTPNVQPGRAPQGQMADLRAIWRNSPAEARPVPVPAAAAQAGQTGTDAAPKGAMPPTTDPHSQNAVGVRDALPPGRPFAADLPAQALDRTAALPAGAPATGAGASPTPGQPAVATAAAFVTPPATAGSDQPHTPLSRMGNPADPTLQALAGSESRPTATDARLTPANEAAIAARSGSAPGLAVAAQTPGQGATRAGQARDDRISDRRATPDITTTPAPEAGRSGTITPAARPPMGPGGAMPTPAVEPLRMAAQDIQGAPESSALGTERAAEVGARSAPTAPAAAPPEAARAPVQQVIQALQRGPGTFDVTLSPEELGRLTMTVSVQDGVMNVTLAAERGETMDLLRRHIDLLTAEAQASGFSDLTFSFGGDGPSDRGQAMDGRSPADPTVGAVPASDTARREAAAPAPLRPTGDGLDLRL